MNKLNRMKKQIIKQMYDNYTKATEWLDTVPREIEGVFYDNPYITHLSENESLLINYVFTEAEREWFDWIMFEWRHNKTLGFSLTEDGPTIHTDNIDVLLDTLFGAESE